MKFLKDHWADLLPILIALVLVLYLASGLFDHAAVKAFFDKPITSMTVGELVCILAFVSAIFRK